MILHLLFFVFITAIFPPLAKTEKTVCYFASWAVYRPGYGAFDVDDVDPFLCTDLIFLIAGLDDETSEIQVLDPWNENCADDDPAGNNCAYDRFVGLKQQNPNLTVTLAVGGSNEGSEEFSIMAADGLRRRIFVDSTVELLLEHGFDGIDLMWEYPGSIGGGSPDDKANYVLLLKDLRSSFDLSDPPFRLTIAVSGFKEIIDDAYDVPGIIDSVDFIHIMSYDYHGPWETETHHQAPLCGYSNDTGNAIYYRVDYPMDYFIQLGAPPEKLVLGVALYGRCWTLNDIENNGMRAQAYNASPAGPYSGSAGYLNYNEICERQISHTCTVVNDEDLQEPYFYCTDDGVWCGYDDAESAYKKARYAKNRGLAGVLVWSMDGEDFHPVCSPEANPVITSVNKAFSSAPDDNPFECPPLGWS